MEMPSLVDKEKITDALVLAGGRGERLRPLTDSMPKPLIKICGRTIIDWQIAMLKANGVENIILSVGYMADRIKKAVGNGAAHGVRVSYVVEDEPLGTAGPLWLLGAQNKLPKKAFVMCNGDELKDIDVAGMLEFHSKSGALATIALTEIEDPRDWGVVRMAGNRIVEFIEKPSRIEDAPSRMINSGFYIIEPGVVEMIPPRKTSMEREVFPRIAAQRKLFGFPFTGQWFPTDTPERIAKAEAGWKTVF